MTLYGPDGSKWQNGIRVSETDWQNTAYGSWRCCYESGALDESYRPMRDQFLMRNIPFDAYVFLSGDPIRQADLACQCVGDKRIPIMADWEKPGYSAGNMFRWIERVRSNGFKVRRLYTGQGFYNASGAPRLQGLGFDLVVARYGDQVPTAQYEMVPRYTYMNNKFGPATWAFNLGGLFPTFWQYSSRVRWGNMYMDMNAYPGLASQLRTWFYVNSDIPDPPIFPPPPPPDPFPHVPYNPIPPFAHPR